MLPALARARLPKFCKAMLNPYPSTAIKAQLLDMIFEELGRAGYEFDRSPDEDVSALRKTDALMAQWEAEGITLNYNFPAIFGNSLPTDAMGVPDAALDTIAAWAAFRVAPGIGKTMSAESRKAMADGKAFLRAETAKIPSMKFPGNTPRGLGNRWSVWRPYFPQTCDQPLTLGDLVLSDASARAGLDYAATLSNIAQGAQLVLVDDAGGTFVLTGNLLRAAALPAGNYEPVVRQILPGATNSAHDTVLSVVST